MKGINHYKEIRDEFTRRKQASEEFVEEEEEEDDDGSLD